MNRGEGSALPVQAREDLRRFLFNLGLTIFSLILLVLGGNLMLGIWMRTAPPEVKVPNLMGVDIAQARRLARNSSLQLELVGEDENSSFPQNSVSWMNPPAGKVVREGRTIEVRVSVPSEMVAVPDLVGMIMEAAVDALLKVNLVGKEEKKVPSIQVAEGAVAVQSPGPGSRVAAGSVVRLFPSEGVSALRPRISSQKAVNEVEVEAPSDGREHQIRIVVEDDYGSRDVYRGRHLPGEKVSSTVESYGPAMVEVYIDERLEARQQLR